MGAFDTSISIHFAPILPLSWLIGVGIVAALLLLLGLYKRKQGTIFRIICAALFLLALSNPSVLEENRQAVKDVAAIVVDQSPSQNYGERSTRTEEALNGLIRQLEGRDDLDIRIIRAPEIDTLTNETRLFDALEVALADVPRARRAGVFVISDGQIHDVPNTAEAKDDYGPVHLLLSGSSDEIDRQLVILEAPSYGIVGKSVTIKYKIEDTGNTGSKAAYVTLKRQNEKNDVISVPVNEEQSLELDINHAGQNVFELATSPVEGEITQANNKAALMVNGVRERLRVLLVSGQPHAGGRTWRDLLTSDPSVDLVHFTILREPDKLDATPQDELSLIAFPFRELFEVKLYEFDLIVFDRYRLNRILPDYYFKNIADYIREGGAFLEASGPSFASEESIYYTALMDVFPGIPTGDMIRKPYRPALTEIGRQHPVTGSLVWKGMSAGSTTPLWGPWLRQVVLERNSGEILMNGAEKNPLLILDRIEKGRIAQLASDQVWLWSRGFEEGGPHTELMRRIVHWLMKEPELDERALNITVAGNTITIRSRDFSGKNSQVLMRDPDEDVQTITLEKTASGMLEAEITVDQIGIYSFEDAYGDTRFAIVGDLNPPELRGVVSTDAPVHGLLEASGGKSIWLSEDSTPTIRMVSSDGRERYFGQSWLGLRQNNEYTVQGLREKDVLPGWLMLSLLLGMAILTWWYEGRLRK